MVICLIIVLGIAGVATARLVFRDWFNHVTVYTVIWGGTLILYDLRLINYYPLELETWLVIGGCWLIFLMGSFTVVAARFSKRRVPRGELDSVGPMDRDAGLVRVKNILWVLNILTLAAALHDLYLISRLFGGLTNALVLGNLLYSYRVSEGLPGSIPYVSSLVFTAALLAGHYTARREKITLVCIMPLIIIIMIDFAYMGRADILIVGVLFVSAYFLTRNQGHVRRYKVQHKLRKLGIVLTIVAIIMGGADFIRSTRQANETIKGSSSELKKLSTSSLITPSIYLYFTAGYGVLNKFVMNEGENTPVGGNTFLPVYRILEKLGVDVHADTYQSWYNTPIRTNTGTYLRELAGDFGISGLLLGPWLIGVLSSFFWCRFKESGKYADLAMSGFFYTIIGMSCFVMPTRISPFFFYAIVSFLVCSYLDRKIFNGHGHHSSTWSASPKRITIAP